MSNLQWSKISDDFDGVYDLDDGVFYGLEEIDGYDVDKSEGILKFVKSEPAKNSQAETEPKAAKSKAKKPKKAKKEQKPAEDHIDFNLIKEAPTEKKLVTSLGEWPQLNPVLLTALKELNFTNPTEIQKQALPPALEGHDVIGKASTGSGKTLAFGLPMIEAFLASDTPEIPQGLVIAPTRELAHQIGDHLNAVFEKCDVGAQTVGCVVLTGGLAFQKQLRLLERNPAIIVGTPGRLFDLLDKMPAAKIAQYQQIPTLVLDEADRLVKNHSFEDMDNILRKIGRSRRQTLVFSATFETSYWSKLDSHRKMAASDIREVLQQKLSIRKNALFIDADPQDAVASAIIQSVMECPAPEKDLYLYYFALVYPGKTIVFVNSIDAVKRLTPMFVELGQNAIGVHSEMVQKKRLRAIERFKEAETGVLFATDVAARGLDVPAVDHVVHYNLPRTADMYVHRSGRTARAGKQGVSLMIVCPQEASTALPRLCKLVKTKPRSFEVEYDVIDGIRDRVALAKKIADSISKTVSEIKAKSWEKQAAEDLGIDVSDEEQETKSDKRLRVQRAELRSLLERNIGPRRRYLTSGSINLAREMTNNPDAVVAGRASTTALESLGKGKKAKVKEAMTKGQMQQVKEKAKSQKRQLRKERAEDAGGKRIKL